MRECKRHSSESQPGGGVCAECLQERLTRLWMGESFRLDDPHKALTPSSVAVSDALPARPVAESQEDVPSVASVRKQLQVNGVARKPGVVASSDVVSGNQRDGGAVVVSASLGDPGDGGKTEAPDTRDVVLVEWTAFHARRRRNLELGLHAGGHGDSPMAKSKSFDSTTSVESIESIELIESVDCYLEPVDIESIVARLSVEANPRLSTLMDAQKMQPQAMPLDNRGSAEETALRVIREQADELHLDYDELDSFGTAEDLQEHPQEPRDDWESFHDNVQAEQGCFSPKWQSRKSPKWVKVVLSPMTSRNRVFPSQSKDDVRKGRGSRKRGRRLASSDWSHAQANGGASPQWMGSSRAPEAIAQQRVTMRSSVSSWLQDENTRQLKRNDKRGQLTSSALLTTSASTDSWLRDLTTVGHLHGIAEELEIVEESSEDEGEVAIDPLEDISSFGKFLLIAAQRQPEAGLTRILSVSARAISN